MAAKFKKRAIAKKAVALKLASVKGWEVEEELDNGGFRELLPLAIYI